MEPLCAITAADLLPFRPVFRQSPPAVGPVTWPCVGENSVKFVKFAINFSFKPFKASFYLLRRLTTAFGLKGTESRRLRLTFLW